MQHDVFISYSSHDKQIADAICSILENSKIRCWIAPRDILPGDTYGRSIINGINDCKIVIIVFSSFSDSSGQVINEIERAVSKSKIIIPFRIENITPSGDMELFLGRRHWLDAMTPPMESHIARLTDTIFRLLDTHKPSSALSPQLSPEPRSETAGIIAGLQIKDSSGEEMIFTEFGVVYNLYAEKVLANSIRNHLIIEKGNAVQEIPWTQIERVDIRTLETVKITLRHSQALESVKLRAGRLVGKDESGFIVVLDLPDILSITPLHEKVKPGETTTISGTESLSNKTGLNATNGKFQDSQKQSFWFMKSTGGPGLRSGFGMTYDSGKEAIILHGGFGRGIEDNRAIASMFLNSPELSDTWIWNGISWMQLKNSPLTLLNHDLAYCKRKNQNVIFGGWNGSQRLDKTYLMNEEDWNPANSNNGSGPEARESHSMVYDEKRKEIILFGGLTMKIEVGQFTKANSIALDDTWAWNGSVWTKLHIKGPEPRWGHRIVYDESRGEIVLFGGYDGSKYFNDTWIWDGNSATWSKITTEYFPLARGYQGMTYDTFSEKVLLFGGLTSSDIVLNDLWEWNGSDWNLINENAQPKPRYKHGFVYDSKRNKTILFGGYDGKEYFQDTWEFSY